MTRKAQELYSADPTKVVFLDFEDCDFDQPQVLKPIKPTRPFWQRVLRVAIDDLSELVAPSRVLICEGASSGQKAGLDAECYDTIFAGEFPETRFLSGGDAHSVRSDRLALMQAITALVSAAKIVRLIDRDDRSKEEIGRLEAEGGTKSSELRVVSLPRRGNKCALHLRRSGSGM